MIVRFSTATERISETLPRSNSEPSRNSRKNAWFNPKSSEQSDTFTPSESLQTNTWNNSGNPENRFVEPTTEENPNSERGDWGSSSSEGIEPRENLVPPDEAPSDSPVSEADENPTEQVPTKRPVKPTSKSKVPNKGGGQTGMASYYGPGFHGRKTASGEIFNKNDLTAAHRSLPFGSKVTVTDLKTGKSVVVRINDRGPFSGGRVIDLSEGAARNLGIINKGVAQVKIT